MFHDVLIDNLWISCKKGGQILPPGADNGRKIKVAGLLRQRVLEKIQNGGRRFTLDWLECLASEESHSIILLTHYIFG